MAISQGLFVAAVFAFTVSCLVMDVRTGRIPNWLTVPAFALGLLTHLGIAGWAGLKFSLLGFATGFGLLLVLMLIGGGGAGDVKMMGALGGVVGVGTDRCSVYRQCRSQRVYSRRSDD